MGAQDGCEDGVVDTKTEGNPADGPNAELAEKHQPVVGGESGDDTVDGPDHRVLTPASGGTPESEEVGNQAYEPKEEVALGKELVGKGRGRQETRESRQ